MATVELKELRKVYPGGVEAVKGVSLDIPDGDLCVLVGPSGCGKSTLLRMIAGLEKVTEGEVLIDGQRVNDREPGERDIAMVFQNYALYPHMKVYDNMAYGLRNRKYSAQEIEERVREAARILELEDLLDRRPRELSGGQRQRVAMGRAIVRHPKAFLFDEPLSNLDAKLRAQMRLEIKKLQSSLKVTSVYVTHDQVEAMTLADILVVLNGGRAEQVGSPMDIYNRPATAFVAGFIGSPSMNFLACSVSPANKGLALASGAVMKPRGMTLPKEAGQRFILGVRPEHLTQVADRNADFEITVSAIETLGADTLTHGHLDGGDGEMVARLPGNVDIREGDRLPLAIQPGFSHIFDGSSGERVPWA